MRLMTWDIFCRIIDNFGDIGVCWRLCADLASRGHTVRLWVDDPSALAWMAPAAAHGSWPGVQVLPWCASTNQDLVGTLSAADVWVEAFGCEIAPEFIAVYANKQRAAAQFGSEFPVWINLEYLSAEPFVERLHTLPSPVGHGPGKGHTKYFYYPGFTPSTGGLLRELDLAHRQRSFDQNEQRRWLASKGVVWEGERLVSLFCYEPAGLASWLQSVATGGVPTRVLVTAGRASAAVHATGQQDTGSLRLHYLPLMTQPEYDALLWCCDLNFVRGEDSLVRALWAAKPLIWQIYPQEDNAHHAKLEAFLDSIAAPPDLRRFHRAWNAIGDATERDQILGNFDGAYLPIWQQSITKARSRLLEQEDLCTQLIVFIEKNR